MEIGEVIAPPAMHTTPNPECPFCPVEEGPHFTSYPGSAKSEDALRDIMADPGVLPSKQSNARPKAGGANQQQRSSSKMPPAPPLQHPVFGSYTYEAHHLIPGTEKVAPGGSVTTVMKGHPIEKWIVAGEKVDKDSGYSINNADNGTWLPSAPAACKKNRANRSPATPWASEAKSRGNPAALTPSEKQEIADFASRQGQFHYGQHKVLDEEGQHYTYAKEVNDRLSDLDGLVAGWAQVCLCDKKQSRPPKPPFKPTWKVNEKLDTISMWIEIDIRLTGPSSWTYFISTLSMQTARRASAMGRI